MSVSKSASGAKTFLTTANPFEKQFGYHRAVRRGPFVFVSGTTAIDPVTGKLEGDGAFHQALSSMARCSEAVQALGGAIEDIVRVKMFVRNFDDTAAVGEAFRQCFGTTAQNSEVGAAATMIVVKDGFVDPEMLVEVEVDAVVD